MQGKPARLKLFCSFVMVVTVFLGGLASYAQAESFLIPGKGTLQLDIPSGWMYEMDSSDEKIPTTIVINAGDANDFVVLITPLWNADEKQLNLTPAKVKDLMLQEGRESLPQAVEDSIKLKEIKGAASYGSCYGLTDKSLVGKRLESGDYRHMVRCSVVVRDILLSATIFTQSADNPHVPEALKMLENARKAQ